MQTKAITPLMVKTAWKMVATIFDRHRCAEPDQNRLLNLTVAVSLHDMLDARLVWKTRPAGPWRLIFEGRQIKIVDDAPPGALRARLLDPEVDQASAEAEDIFDRYGLDEDERDTLFTALPCLGLKAMEPQLEWNSPPPFPEVG